jgi:hypothetical protein
MFEVGTKWIYKDCGYKHRLTILSREDSIQRLGERFVDTTNSTYVICYDALTGTTRAISKEELRKHGREVVDVPQAPREFQPTNLLGGIE